MTFEEALVALTNNTAIDIDLTGEAFSKAQMLELCSALASNVSLQRLCLEEVGLEADVAVAKNYLTQDELTSLGRIVISYLDLAEERAKRKIPMSMEDWAKRPVCAR